MRPLGYRLFGAGLAAMLTLAVCAAWITVRAANAYYDELLQKLNGSIAMYIDQEAPLIRSGVVDHARLSELARRAMIINPIAEVYLLDEKGHVVRERGAVDGVRVDLRPIRRFLEASHRGPVHGTDPRTPAERRVFSAAEIRFQDRLEGYVYVILGGARHDSVAASIAGSYILQAAMAALAVVLILAIATAWAGTVWLTRPMRALHASIVRVGHELSVGGGEPSRRSRDDLAEVRDAFESMARRLRHHIDSLREADRLRRELFANASHDLRTPLTSMRGYLETLQLEDARLSASRRAHFVDIALRQCGRVERLVQQLLALARLDGPKIALHPEAVAVAELAQDIVTKSQLRAEQAGVRLEVQREPSPRVIADIGALECVIENLLDNALRHSHEGGTIAVRVCGAVEGVAVEIEDTGDGIAEADLVRVQERFETGGGGHIGLGLAIVRRALHLHGSQLELTSRVGEGTLARFVLTRTEQAADRAQPFLPDSREESVSS